MSNFAKRKGYAFEVEVVKAAKKHGLEAERAWGSDGRALGLNTEVDVLVTHDLSEAIYEIQCKRVAAVAKKYMPSEGIFAQAFRPDRGEAMAMIRLEDLFKLIANQ